MQTGVHMHFKTWLQLKGIHQKDMALTIGIKPSSLSMILSGKTKPSLEIASLIEKITNGEITRMDLLYPDETDTRQNKSSPRRGTIVSYELRDKLLKEVI
jgi:DNA-binding transcriptional regulator YdaS (Cro superfamily)